MRRWLKYVKSLNYNRSRVGTVRFMFPALVSLMAVLGAAAITATDVSYIRLASSQATIESGSRFYIDVYAYAHVPVNAVDVTLQFNGDAVEVLGVDKGQSVLTLWTEEPVIENNKVILRGGTFKKGFIREHKIATIEVKAKQTGQSEFKATDVVLLAGDGKGSPVSVADANTSKVSLYVYDENTSPENIGVNIEVNIITDIDGDGKVTLKDVSSFMTSWTTKDKVYDFNGDGRMTFKDFSIILANFIF